MALHQARSRQINGLRAKIGRSGPNSCSIAGSGGKDGLTQFQRAATGNATAARPATRRPCAEASIKSPSSKHQGATSQATSRQHQGTSTQHQASRVRRSIKGPSRDTHQGHQASSTHQGTSTASASIKVHPSRDTHSIHPSGMRQVRQGVRQGTPTIQNASRMHQGTPAASLASNPSTIDPPECPREHNPTNFARKLAFRQISTIPTDKNPESPEGKA